MVKSDADAARELSGMRALVTGGSGGIGAAIARELAQRGADLILTARRKDALAEVAASCAAHGVQVDTIAADLGADGGAQNVWRLATQGGERPIDVVVNNAGFGAFRAFADTDWPRDDEMIELNMRALVYLSKRFVEHARGRRGYLLNIASIGAYQSVPNMALYGASKAFVRNFTEGVHDELRAGGADFANLSATCVCPGGTRTAFHAAAGAHDYSWIANASMASAEFVARAAVRAMLARRRTTIPGLINKLSCWGVRLVPRRLASWIAARILGRPAPALPPRAVG